MKSKGLWLKLKIYYHKMVGASGLQVDYSREKRPLARMMAAAQTVNNPLEEKTHWIAVIQLLQLDYLVAGAIEESRGYSGELNCQSVQLQYLDY